MTKTIEQGKEEVRKLSAYFATNRQAFLAPGVKEDHVRQSLIDPLFEALGWDVHNRAMTAPQYREVIREDSLDVEGHQKAPDYTFRVGTLPKFYAEAKKCAVNIGADSAPAFQLRRYGFSRKLTLSILTNFEELGVYDCTMRPYLSDKASHARIEHFRFDEYPDRWRELWDVFSREAVWSGAFDQFAASKRKRGTSEVDADFLEDMEGWREALARNIALRNGDISSDDPQAADLNAAVQLTIDRVVFLRMAEDRGLEPYEQLLKLCERPDIYPRFMRDLCRRADEKYNSGLFHFQKESGVPEEPDRITTKLEVDDKVFKPILESLYFEHGSPYHFGIMPVEILGTAYERFLGNVIRLTHGHQAKIEEKPEVRKARGVYYTPAYIVEYIVKQTVDRQIEGRSPGQLAGLRNGKEPFRVLDMACGSGSFLLGAYQLLLDHCLDWYTKHDPKKYKKAVYNDPRNSHWRLTIEEKKRILTTHIFGVDIDPQAVEVTKLSLLLKVLEGETDQSLSLSQLPFGDRALPNLADNIKCGNSLIGPDYFTGKLIVDPEEAERMKPFDWKEGFPGAIKAGGFDCVIGNPPYISMLLLDKSQAATTKDYWKQEFQSASGAFDIYVLFVEMAVRLVRAGGFVSYIVPNKFLAAEYAIDFRKWLLQNCQFVSLLDFSRVKVWPVSVYPVVPVFRKSAFGSKKKIAVAAATKEGLDNLRILAPVPTSRLKQIPDNLWSFMTREGADILLKVIGISVPLEKVADVWGASTVAEGSEYPRLLVDKGSVRLKPNLARFVVSGAVGRYATTWETEPIRFMHKVYTRPLIRLRSPMPDRRARQARKAKIVISKVALEPRAFPDLNGEFVGGYTTYVFSESMSLHSLAAIINSRLMRFLYRMLYDALAMGGGYLRFQPPQIRRMPIRSFDPSSTAGRVRQDKIVALVDSTLALHKQLASAKSASHRAIIHRQIDAADAKIDRLVYELYGLTAEEIALVERSEM